VRPAGPPTLGRWLRQTPGGRLVVDRAKVKAEARLDGNFLLSTSDPDLSTADVALGYKNLLGAERAFRDLKTVLELRPIWHRLEHRIRAHVPCPEVCCRRKTVPAASHDRLLAQAIGGY
jgi:hypothetical protein